MADGTITGRFTEIHVSMPTDRGGKVKVRGIFAPFIEAIGGTKSSIKGAEVSVELTVSAWKAMTNQAVWDQLITLVKAKDSRLTSAIVD